jgi:hypothetical protein
MTNARYAAFPLAWTAVSAPRPPQELDHRLDSNGELNIEFVQDRFSEIFNARSPGEISTPTTSSITSRITHNLP